MDGLWETITGLGRIFSKQLNKQKTARSVRKPLTPISLNAELLVFSCKWRCPWLADELCLQACMLTGQPSHVSRPVWSWYVPAAQIVHDDAPVAGWRHPAGQLSHAAALERPVCALYVPAAQAVFVAGSGQ